MKRNTNAGGKSTRAARRAAALAADPDVVDVDALDRAGFDWDQLSVIELELDPALAECLRTRRRLRQLTLRVGEDQIAEAKRVAKETGMPYQSILRRWLAEGASRARSKRQSAK